MVMLTLAYSAKLTTTMDKYKIVIIRLGTVIITNFLVSFTVTTLSILSLVIYVPASLEAMLAFLLFPFNSCINPVLNTITTKGFIQYVHSKHTLQYCLHGTYILASQIKKYIRKKIIWTKLLQNATNELVGHIIYSITIQICTSISK